MNSGDPRAIRADPAPRSPRYPGLDFWRGAACLAVVLYHAGERGYPMLLKPGSLGRLGRGVLWTTLQGWAGVPLFFVISGYCIAASADSARRRPGGAWSFAIGRARRVFPPYWAALALTSIALIVLGSARFFVGNWSPIPSPGDLNAAQWFANLTLTANWLPGVIPGFGDSRLLLGPAWTLGYEVQFYAIVGLIVAVAPRRLFAGCALVTAATLAAAPLRRTTLWSAIDGTFLDGRWAVFAIGILVYQQINYRSRALVPWLLAASAGAIAGSGLTRFHLAEELAIALGFGAILCPGHRLDGVLSRSILAGPIRACGLMSYSLYLVHWPIVRVVSHAFAAGFGPGNQAALFASMIAGTAASILAGWLFHVGIERRFLNSGKPGRAAAMGAVRARAAVAGRGMEGHSMIASNTRFPMGAER